MLRYLFMPGLYAQAAHWGVTWAFGYVAGFALLVQLLRRRLDREHLALAVGNGRSSWSRCVTCPTAQSPNKAYDTFWQQPANYHDPRIFYLSWTHGCTLGSEQQDVKLVAAAVSRGARYFVDPLVERSAVLDGWLAARGELVWSQPRGGRIWKVNGSAL